MKNSEKEYHAKVRDLGCIICQSPCSVHHCKTGAGGRKNHMLVIGLCHYHHQGDEGIHTLGRKAWQAKYETEDYYMDLTNKELGL